MGDAVRYGNANWNIDSFKDILDVLADV